MVKEHEKKYIKCPECHGTGVSECGINGYYLACETCHGEGILERVEKEDPVKEVTNDDIANMLQRIHHENSFIINCICQMARINNDDIDRLINDWDEEFKKAKGEWYDNVK